MASKHRLGTLAIVVVGTLSTAIWWLPKVQIKGLDLGPDVEELKIQELENEYRKTIAQILFGLGVFASFYVAFRRVIATEEGQITERFTKAIELLSSEEHSKALGGAYALGRVAADSGRDAWTVIEVLAAYARDKFPATGEGDDTPANTSTSLVAEAVLKMIGAHNPRKHKEGRRVMLNRCRFRSMDLSGGYYKDGDFSQTLETPRLCRGTPAV